MGHKIETNWKKGMAFEAITESGTVSLDAGEAVGGNDAGLRPKSLMLVALAGCTAMDVASLFTKMRAEPDDFKVNISAELTDKHPKIYKNVKIEYKFWGKDLKKDKLEKAVNLSATRYCGVNAMFNSFSEVTTEITFIDTNTGGKV